MSLFLFPAPSQVVLRSHPPPRRRTPHNAASPAGQTPRPRAGGRLPPPPVDTERERELQSAVKAAAAFACGTGGSPLATSARGAAEVGVVLCCARERWRVVRGAGVCCCCGRHVPLLYRGDQSQEGSHWELRCSHSQIACLPGESSWACGSLKRLAQGAAGACSRCSRRLPWCAGALLAPLSPD